MRSLHFFQKLVNDSPANVTNYTIASITTIFLSIVVSIIVYTVIFISLFLRFDTFKTSPLLHQDTSNGWYLHNVFRYLEIIISSVGLLGLAGLVWLIVNYKLMPKLLDLSIDTTVWLIVIFVVLKFILDAFKTSTFYQTFKEYNQTNAEIKEALYSNLDLELFKKLRKAATGRPQIVAKYTAQNNIDDTDIRIHVTSTFLSYLENTSIPSKTIDNIMDGVRVDPISFVTASTFNILEKTDEQYTAEFNTLYEKIANNVQRMILLSKTANVFPVYLGEIIIIYVVTMVAFSLLSRKVSV